MFFISEEKKGGIQSYLFFLLIVSWIHTIEPEEPSTV